jgi:hypothetical protein
MRRSPGVFLRSTLPPAFSGDQDFGFCPAASLVFAGDRVG